MPLINDIEEQVVLVNEQNQEIGVMGKMEAHEKGLLHRAFSVFVFNTQGQLLLQQRALSKYHSPAKWTNTCCSHPRFNESVLQGAERRLNEEMGMSCELTETFDFIYKAELDQGLTEHEYDFVFVGISDDKPMLNPEEVEDFRYMDMDLLEGDIAENPDYYTEWLKICFPRVMLHYQKLFKNGKLAS